VSDQSPLSGSKEGVAFDVRCACAGSKSAVFVFNEQFSYKGFAETVVISTHSFANVEIPYLEI
jgi:hypothetical protein